MLHWGAGRRFVRWGPGTTAAVVPETETTALIAAMSVAPDATRQTLINTTILSLKNAGVWSKLDLLFVTAAHDAQAARLNWITPAGTGLTATNSPAFTVDRGYLGDGTTSGLQTTGLNMSALTNFKQDTATVFAWSRTDTQNANNDFGAATGSSNTFFAIRTASNTFNMRLNSVSTSTPANSGGIGLFGAVRNNAANFDAYKNGSSLGNLVIASVVTQALPFGLCRGGTTFGIRQMAAGGAGSALTSTQWGDLYNAMAAWMTAVGA